MSISKTECNDRLTSNDKAQLAEAMRIKQSAGDRVWPGFGSAEIPLILYNGDYQFLVGIVSPPPDWTPVEEDTFQEKPYFRRLSKDSQAFAVPLDTLWAGSLDTLDHMNSSMREQIRDKVPPEKLTPEFIAMMQISPAQHVTALLHEVFHAFQAIRAPERFSSAEAMYQREKLYPFDDESFNATWNREGELLVRALNSRKGTDKREAVRDFLKTRSRRRSDLSLSAELVAFERELEWLEGLAKYVEIEIARAETDIPDESGGRPYRIVWNRLRSDLFFRLKSAGEQNGDLRFYLTGAAQALLLDKFSPGWKNRLIKDQDLVLEDLLRTAVDSPY